MGSAPGAIQGALGAEYRTEKGQNVAAQGIPDYVRTDYNVQYGESFAGDVDVTEGYGELNIPVLRNVVAAKKLDFNLAARISRYDNQGKEGTSGLVRDAQPVHVESPGHLGSGRLAAHPRHAVA